VLWQDGLSSGVHKQFCTWLNLDDKSVGRLVTFWSSLHDIGKASRSFQGKCEFAIPILKSEGYPFTPLVEHDIRHHSLLSAWILDRQRERLHLIPEEAALKLLLALAGHHGKFPWFGGFNEETYQKANLGIGMWIETQDKIVTMMENLLLLVKSLAYQRISLFPMLFQFIDRVYYHHRLAFLQYKSISIS